MTASERAAKFRLGAQVTVADLESDCYHLLHQLRAAEPVSWLPAIDAWLVTGYDLAVAVMRDAAAFTVDHPGFSTAQVVGPSMLSLDGAAHRRHRAPFEGPFRKRAVQKRFAGPVAAQITRLLAELAPAGAAELRRAYAGPVAAATMIHALGLTNVPTVAVLNWYDAIVAAVTAISAGAPLSASGRTAYAELRQRLLAALAATPESSLLAAVAAGTTLDAEAIAANAAILLFGGIETTEGMIANALFHLLTNPPALAAVRADPNLVPAALEESLRLEPAAAVVDRYAVGDVTLAGAAIKAGDLVRVSLLGANRDPAVFANPDQFDLARPNHRAHVTFAQGPHVCLGLHLARLEAALAVREALQRLPDLALAEGTGGPTGLIFRKPAGLPVTWTA